MAIAATVSGHAIEYDRWTAVPLPRECFALRLKCSALTFYNTSNFTALIEHIFAGRRTTHDFQVETRVATTILSRTVTVTKHQNNRL